MNHSPIVIGINLLMLNLSKTVIRMGSIHYTGFLRRIEWFGL